MTLCTYCLAPFITSHEVYPTLCEYCGNQEWRLAERVVEEERGVEWSVVAMRATHGEPAQIVRRWRIA